MVTSWNHVDRIMQRGVGQRWFRSACLLVASEGQPLWHQAYGRASLDSVFDLASLTKPLATAAVATKLCEDGSLDPAVLLSEVLPVAAPHPIGQGTVGQLLSHCSGLPAWQPFYLEHAGLSARSLRQRVRRSCLRQRLAYRPGSRSVYSDLGYILLDWVLERVGGKPLHVLAQERIFQPLGLSRTGFNDLTSGPLPPWRFVPTERCGRQRLRGQVHDDNCRAMGGVCGHAGLFSTAHDVYLMAREWVAAYDGRRSLFDRDVVRHFWKTQPVRRSSWALGWDRPLGKSSSAGQHFSATSVGHLGFTGTSLWIDLRCRVWVVLLTNRVYYGREPNPMKRFRPRLHDAVMRTLR